MPGYDGTGPSGGGPMTGRGRGLCVTPSRRRRAFSPRYGPDRFYGRPRLGLGMRRGMGGRYARRRWW
ncbi:MAG: DUF5320 domain-containing protein [Firmicutes bacterium]|nr:DUF5320 domain-containing protein [Bacillota bacterium]